MKKTGILAKRYAKALFGLAMEMNNLEEVRKDMELIFDVYKQNKDFRLILDAPIVSIDKKKAVLNSLFKKHVNEITLRYLMIILRKRREAYLGNIAEQFISLYKEFKSIIIVHLQTAAEIDDTIRNKVIKLLEDQTKGNIELHEAVKKEIIGGFILTYDDKKYDDSISTQLQLLRRDVAALNLYVRGI